MNKPAVHIEEPTPSSKLTRPKYEVADVVRLFFQKHTSGKHLPLSQKWILEDILYCRTAGMGGHVSQCDRCRHIEISYNSCRNRHCNKCQSLNRAIWLEKRKMDLLPVN